MRKIQLPGKAKARPAGQSFSPAALAPAELVPEAVEPPPEWNKSVRQWDFLKVGNFVLRTTKLRTWMAAGALHLHQIYPADGYISTTVGLPKVGNFVLRTTKLRAWIAAGAMHLHQIYPADGWEITESGEFRTPYNQAPHLDC